MSQPPRAVRLIRTPGKPDEPDTYRAIVGWKLTRISPQSPIDHFFCLHSLLSTFPELVPDLVSVTLDSRIIVWPDPQTPERSSVGLYLLAGVSELNGTRRSVRQKALEFAREWEDSLSVDAAAYRVEPLLSDDALDVALNPFPIRDGYEVRPPEQSMRAGLSPSGPVEYEGLVRHMQFQRQGVVLSCRIQPAAPQTALLSGPTLSSNGSSSQCSLLPTSYPGDGSNDDRLSGDFAKMSDPESAAFAWAWRMMNGRQSHLSPRMYLVKVVILSRGGIRRALRKAVEDELAWGSDEMTVPATAVKLRNTPARLSELKKAAMDLRTLTLHEIGGQGISPTDNLYGLKTISRVFPLLRRAPWPDDPPPGSFRPLRPR